MAGDGFQSKHQAGYLTTAGNLGYGSQGHILVGREEESHLVGTALCQLRVLLDLHLELVIGNVHLCQHLANGGFHLLSSSFSALAQLICQCRCLAEFLLHLLLQLVDLVLSVADDIQLLADIQHEGLQLGGCLDIMFLLQGIELIQTVVHLLQAGRVVFDSLCQVV